MIINPTTHPDPLSVIPLLYQEASLKRYSCFLAGSIGGAANWQVKFAKRIQNLFIKNDCFIINPRRDSFPEQPTDEILQQQIHWEITTINLPKSVIFYFDPKTKAPISLLELGYVIGKRSNMTSFEGAPHNSIWSQQEIYVCCPQSFYRHNNVKYMCAYTNIPIFESLEMLFRELSKNYFNIL